MRRKNQSNKIHSEMKELAYKDFKNRLSDMKIQLK